MCSFFNKFVSSNIVTKVFFDDHHTFQQVQDKNIKTSVILQFAVIKLLTIVVAIL